MTEDDAKTKKCCGRVYVHVTDVCGLTVKVSDTCIASNCMAWREIITEEWVDPPTNSTVATESHWVQTIGGYCGLAGVARS